MASSVSLCDSAKSPLEPFMQVPMYVSTLLKQRAGLRIQEIDRLLRQAEVTLNGVVVKERTRLVFPSDILRLEGRKVSLVPRPSVVYALYKPKCMETTLQNTSSKSLSTWLKKICPDRELRPIGRLDKMTTGLLLAQDGAGDLCSAIISPGALAKTYIAKVRCRCSAEPTTAQLAKLISDDGIPLPDGSFRFLKCQVLGHSMKIYDPKTGKSSIVMGAKVHERGGIARLNAASDTAAALVGKKRRRPDAGDNEIFTRFECTLRLEIDIGKYHIVRRLLAKIGLPVIELHREAIGDLCLGNIGLDTPRQSTLLRNEQVEKLWVSAAGGSILSRRLSALVKLVKVGSSAVSISDRTRLSKWLSSNGVM